MRLLHTADLHLGKILHEQSLLEDQEFVLDQLAQELESGGYDLFVVAGDVFDRSVPPPEALSLWDRFLARISSQCPRLQVVIISGNHDGAQRLAFASTFLASHNIHVRTGTHDLDRPLSLTLGGQAWDVFAVPFLQAGTLERRSEAGEPVVLRSQRDLWDEARQRLGVARRPGVKSILVAHLFTLGGTETDSERLFVGEAEQIPASWLEGWDYVALGHLHRAQEPAPGVRYSGSPLAYSFGETDQEKVALRWEDGVTTPVRLSPLRPLTSLRGTFDEFIRGDGGDRYQDHWLELTLTDAALVSHPLERLRARFPRLLSLVQAPAKAESSSDAPRRRTGDVAADALRFLVDVGFEPGPGAPELLAEAAREAQTATP